MKPQIQTKVRRLGRAAVLAASLGLAASSAWAGLFNPNLFTLENGMQVVVIEDHRAPVVTQMVWYKVGAADEPVGKSGIAHLLEHLMFKGTETAPGKTFSQTVAAGGFAGKVILIDAANGKITKEFVPVPLSAAIETASAK